MTAVVVRRKRTVIDAIFDGQLIGFTIDWRVLRDDNERISGMRGS